jgi:hypothetical protein
MCIVTLSYNENNKVAAEKLAVLLGTGLFEKLDIEDLDIADSDSMMSDDERMALSLDKESYTPEELREMLVNDVKELYGVKDTI